VKRNIVIACVTLGVVANLEAQRCAVCDLGIATAAYLLEDQVTKERRQVCVECASLSTVCYLCGLPVKYNITRLDDGRVLCLRDSNGVVLADQEAEQVCAETRIELDRLFSRFLTFPATNVTIALADAVHMKQLFQTPGFDRQCSSVFGYIKNAIDDPGAHRHHVIRLLTGLPKPRLMATCAHEMAHSWLNENLRPDRRINLDAVEAFCELVAFKLMTQLGQEQEQKVIKSNFYTRGQFDLFQEADDRYGFYTIMQWMKSGLDARLTETDLDRVRQIKASPQPSTPAGMVSWAQPGTTPVPDTLTIMGISGAGSRRLALIDDLAFCAGESGKVRVGRTNVMVKCLEIRSNSVVIEVEGSPGKQELFLKSK